jgi:hypothetical protein
LIFSDAGRQVGEAVPPGNDGVKLGQLLVAAVVAAFGDELARRAELFARLLAEPAAAAAPTKWGGGGLGSTKPANGARASRCASASRAQR